MQFYLGRKLGSHFFPPPPQKAPDFFRLNAAHAGMRKDQVSDTVFTLEFIRNRI